MAAGEAAAPLQPPPEPPFRPGSPFVAAARARPRPQGRRGGEPVGNPPCKDCRNWGDFPPPVVRAAADSLAEETVSLEEKALKATEPVGWSMSGASTVLLASSTGYFDSLV